MENQIKIKTIEDLNKILDSIKPLNIYGSIIYNTKFNCPEFQIRGILLNAIEEINKIKNNSINAGLF